MTDEILEDNNNEAVEENEESSGRNLAPIIIGVWVLIALSLVGVFVFILNRNPAAAPTAVESPSQSDAALKPYLDRLKKNPNDVDAMFSLGHILADSQRAPEAINYYNRILDLEKDNLTALVDLAAAQIETGDGNQAIANIEKALKIQPDFDYGLYVKANYLFSIKKDFQGSLDILRSLEKVLSPGNKLDSVKQNITLVEQQLQQGGSAPAPTPAP